MAARSQKPLISIITCTLNSEEYLAENITSVKEQTFTNYEHIFIDGYSKDKTLQIINTYKKGRKNIKLYKQKPRGISSAMNEGVTKATGQYILHLHSDDKLANTNSLKKASKLIERKSPYMLIGKIIEIDERGKSFGSFPPGWVFKMPDLFLNFLNFIPHQGVFLRKEVFIKEGMFNSRYKYCMDYDLWLRIYKNINVEYLDYPISKYRVHASANSFNKSHTKAIKKEYKSIQFKYSPKSIHGAISLFDRVVRMYLSLKRGYQKWANG